MGDGFCLVCGVGRTQKRINTRLVIMDEIDKAITVTMLIVISIAAINWIGQEFHALLAMFNLLVGVLIGMTIFMPNRKVT